MDIHNPQAVPSPQSEILGYYAVLISDRDEFSDLWLPRNPDGFYHFPRAESAHFLSIEGRDGQWYACCHTIGYFKNVDTQHYSALPLKDGQWVEIEENEHSYELYTEVITKERLVFSNYILHPEVTVTVGSDPSCDIHCSNPMIASTHAVITRFGKQWSIESGRHEMVFVNAQPVTRATLSMGDLIYLNGLRILIGSNFISINDGDGRATVNPRILRQTTARISAFTHYSGQHEEKEPEEEFFNRAPRKHLAFEEKVITVEAPPLSMARAQMPLMLRMGSSMVMSGRAALSGNYASLLSSLLFPFLSSKYTEKQREEYEARRETKYTEYLEMKRKEILAACAEAESRQNQLYPDMNAVLSIAQQRTQLWERRPIDDDFLCLRLGTGEQELRSTIDHPVRHFELEPDDLEEKMYQLVEQKFPLHNVPIVLPFTQDYICGIRGKRKQLLDLVYQLVLQISVLHSYDEVKLIFLLKPEELKRWEFIRYLPHAWDDQRSLRFIATNEVEAYRLGEYIKNLLPEELDSEHDLSQALKHRPYHIVVALDRKLFNSIEILKNILTADHNHGISILAAFDNLPKECHRIVRLAPSGLHCVTSLRPNGGPDEYFLPDYCDRDKASEVAKTLANLTLKTVSHAQELPKMVTFLEMFRAGRVEHLNSLKRWRENNPVKSLAAPVGVAPDGSLFMLDLHEKHQGPHGLVAGMTGSGKSEFIITYILSMAVNYHPDEVAFILIDYKGGGLAGAFDNPATGLKLPHLVGTITNLDGAAIHRSLKSIESELMRRQRILNEAKNAVNEGTMDIYSYQKLYRAGKVSEPLPHLFIISDEFAELKSQQPEFMEKLISAARIGRSLGVHLILATQKPAGVVNDQIRSNTKFRVCLRVQDKTDSMDMLKRPEAAELTDTGRFYLQVGYNEFFAIGQSAWCGASYDPQDTVQIQKDDSVEVLDLSGQIITRGKPKVKVEKSGMKQIVAIVKYLSDLAKLEAYTPKSLWKEPLPKKLTLGALQEKYPCAQTSQMQIPIGIADDPERQDQYLFTLHLQSNRNLLIAGESGSGKSTMLQTLLYSMAHRFSPEQVNFYIFDFSNKLLSSFNVLPHCGAYLTEENESDYERFFTFITDEIARRKKLFEDAGVHSYDDYIQARSLPLIFVVIDNISGLSTSKVGANLLYKIHEYLRSGLGYGVQYIVTASFINQLSAKARQEIADRITFRAKDRFAYGEILGKKTKHEPQDLPGRGMCLIDERPLEFHAAMIDLEGTALEVNAQMNRLLKAISQRFAACTPALRMLTLDENQTYADFCRFFKTGRIPLGYDVKDIRPIALPLKQMNCLSVYFGNPVGVAPVLRNILFACQRENMKVLVVRKTFDSAFGASVIPAPDTELLSCTEADSHLLLERMMQETKERVPYRNEYCQHYGIDKTSPDAASKASDYVRSKTTGLMVLFESFADFCANADPDCKKTFFKFFQLGRGLNYYFTGCFYPDDTKKVTGSEILRGFNPDKHALLFGGQFSRQDIVPLPYEYKAITGEAKQYNNFLMYYQSKIHPMQMPCGQLEDGFADEDSAPIF